MFGKAVELVSETNICAPAILQKILKLVATGCAESFGKWKKPVLSVRQ